MRIDRRCPSTSAPARFWLARWAARNPWRFPGHAPTSFWRSYPTRGSSGIPRRWIRTLDAVGRLLDSLDGGFLAEGEGYLRVLERIARPALLQGAVVHDARIAALCLYHGVRVLWSADRDFSRFPDLAVANPPPGGLRATARLAGRSFLRAPGGSKKGGRAP